MTVIRHNPHAGLRVEFRPDAREPWCVVGGGRVAAFARKAAALAEYRDVCDLARRGLPRLPFHGEAA